MAEQLRTTSTSSHLKNRRIFTGGQSTTWQVPEGTTEVWVHVWGGGGSSCGVAQACCPQCLCPKTGAAGGGGGYSRAIYSVTDADTLSITVGGDGGTSSVTIPTQTPGSPLSATGGGSASSATSGGSGGTGSITLNPTFSTYYCMTASGGSGGAQYSPSCCGYGGGGAAGSPLGPGGNGMDGVPNGQTTYDPGNYCCWNYCTADGGSGGGIGGSNGVIMVTPDKINCTTFQCTSPGSITTQIVCTICRFQLTGGSALQTNAQIMLCNGDMTPGGVPSANGNIFGSVGNFDAQVLTCNTISCGICVNVNCAGCPKIIYNSTNLTKSSYLSNTTSGIDWFYVEDIAGSSGYFNYATPQRTNLSLVGDGAGGAGGAVGPTSNAGFLGGGGGRGCDICNTTYNPPANPGTCPFSCGGCAGGAGATCVPVPGTPGAVIIYW